MDDRLLMIDKRSLPNHQSSITNHHRVGHTLVEVITVVLVLSILACIAVPRLNLTAVWGARTDAAVQRLVTDLRRTRILAITRAAENPDGFALVLPGPDPCRSYRITDLHDRTTVTSGELPPGVQCGGGARFEFGPLGNLQNGSDTCLHVRSTGKAYRIEITPATGAVEWRRDNDQQ